MVDLHGHGFNVHHDSVCQSSTTSGLTAVSSHVNALGGGRSKVDALGSQHVYFPLSLSPRGFTSRGTGPHPKVGERRKMKCRDLVEGDWDPQPFFSW